MLTLQSVSMWKSSRRLQSGGGLVCSLRSLSSQCSPLTGFRVRPVSVAALVYPLFPLLSNVSFLPSLFLFYIFTPSFSHPLPVSVSSQSSFYTDPPPPSPQLYQLLKCRLVTSTETAGLLGAGSPGRPPRLSHSSWTLDSISLKSVLHPPPPPQPRPLVPITHTQLSVPINAESIWWEHLCSKWCNFSLPTWDFSSLSLSLSLSLPPSLSVRARACMCANTGVHACKCMCIIAFVRVYVCVCARARHSVTVCTCMGACARTVYTDVWLCGRVGSRAAQSVHANSWACTSSAGNAKRCSQTHTGTETKGENAAQKTCSTSWPLQPHTAPWARAADGGHSSLTTEK